MCKLFAYVNFEDKNLPHYVGVKVNKALRHLFYINSYGQVDGSGLMWMDKKGKTDFLKAPVPSPTFMEFSSFSRIKDTLHKNKFVAGHTRYSTVGSNTWENSHPFEFNNFMGIQNGTISNHHKSLVPNEVSPCEVDSASVFWSFDRQGVKNTLDRYEGEGVFMFFNKEERSFNVVKNSYRTLYIGKMKSYNVFFLATDKFALDFVSERNNIELEEVTPFVNDSLVKFTEDNKIRHTKMEVHGPVLKNYNGNYGNYSGYNNNYGGNYSGNYKSKNKANHTVKSNNSNKAVSTNTSKEKSTTSVFKHPDRLEGTYIQDCDICSSPIFSNSLAFSDDQNPLRSTYLACSCCEEQLKSFLGSKPYKLDLSKDI